MEQNADKVFFAKCKEIMAEQGCTVQKAAEKVRIKHPTLYKSYVNQLLSLSGLEYK